MEGYVCEKEPFDMCEWQEASTEDRKISCNRLRKRVVNPYFFIVSLGLVS